jgi:hypothetical protein
MPRKKSIRVKRWKVRVFQDHVAKPTVYTVYAVDQWDARLLAFALDGGFPYSMTEMEEGHTELAMEYTEILESS